MVVGHREFFAFLTARRDGHGERHFGFTVFLEPTHRLNLPVTVEVETYLNLDGSILAVFNQDLHVALFVVAFDVAFVVEFDAGFLVHHDLGCDAHVRIKPEIELRLFIDRNVFRIGLSDEGVVVLRIEKAVDVKCAVRQRLFTEFGFLVVGDLVEPFDSVALGLSLITMEDLHRHVVRLE